jgi:hypothetical protein
MNRFTLTDDWFHYSYFVDNHPDYQFADSHNSAIIIFVDFDENICLSYFDIGNVGQEVIYFFKQLFFIWVIIIEAKNLVYRINRVLLRARSIMKTR